MTQAPKEMEIVGQTDSDTDKAVASTVNCVIFASGKFPENDPVWHILEFMNSRVAVCYAL